MPTHTRDDDWVRAARDAATRLNGSLEDLNTLLDMIGDAHVVLIGEASHGRDEFYAQRVELTKRLITGRGFCAVAAEADWPETYRVNRYVRGIRTDGDAEEALLGFKRFPAWMWRNADVLDFIGWLGDHNKLLPAAATR